MTFFAGKTLTEDLAFALKRKHGHVRRWAKEEYEHLFPSADHVRLGLAVMANEVGPLSAILEKQPDLVNAVCVCDGMHHLASNTQNFMSGPSLLQVACQVGAMDAVHVLLKIPGIDVNQTCNGKASTATALTWLVSDLKSDRSLQAVPKSERIALATKLVEAGANPLHSASPHVPPLGQMFYVLFAGGFGPYQMSNLDEMDAVFGFVKTACDHAPFGVPADEEDHPLAAVNRWFTGLADLGNPNNPHPACETPRHQVWLREKTGIDLPTTVDILTAFALARCGWPGLVDLARNHVPAAMAFHEAQGLGERLDRAAEAVLPRLSRL
jgi:hypothetical protein